MDWDDFLPGECQQRSRIIPYLELMLREQCLSGSPPLMPSNCGKLYEVDNVSEVDNVRFNVEAHVVLMMRDSVANGNVEWLRKGWLMNSLCCVMGPLTWFKTLTEDGQLELCRSVLSGLAWANQQRYIEDAYVVKESFGAVSTVYCEKTAEAVEATGVLELRDLYYMVTGSMTPLDAQIGHCVVHGSRECGVCNDLVCNDLIAGAGRFEQRMEDGVCVRLVDGEDSVELQPRMSG